MIEATGDAQPDGTEPATGADGGMWGAVVAGLALVLLAVACIDASGRDSFGLRRDRWLTLSPWTWIAALALVLALIIAVRVVLVRRRSGRAAPVWFRSWTAWTYLLAVGFVVVCVIYTVATPASKMVVVEGRPRRRRLRGSRCTTASAASTAVAPSPVAPAGSVALADEERTRLEQMWTRAAGHEAESIASFLQLEADLAAVGAPPELCARARVAAQDEVRHTTFARRVAREVNGARQVNGDGAVEQSATEAPAYRAPRRNARSGPARQYRLLRLAVESYVDGCGNEGAEADRLRYAAEHAAPELRDELAIVAADEAAHAELAWAVVEWAVVEGGPAVRWALTHRPLPAPADPGPSAASSEHDAALQAWGWVPPTVRRRCVEQARTSARLRLEALTA